ncbi:dipicolinate synthase subunit DpsA [Paenibacillus sp. CMAA1364]
MLTGVRIVFIGGDARQIEVIRACSHKDAIVTMVGFDELTDQLGDMTRVELTTGLLEQADILVLPVIGCNNEGEIATVFSSQPLQLLEEHFEALPQHCMVFTGIAKSYLREMCATHELRLVELLERDDVAIYNSIPTAEGAIMMAIQQTDFTIHGSKCMVLGMGRTGFTLAKSLQGLGAKITMGVRSEVHFARAIEMGWEPFVTRDLGLKVSDINLLFNTIPTMMVTAQILSQIPPNAVIIDLASAPGGCDFRFAEKRGIKALLAPGLPGIVAPKTAGNIIANALIQLISDEIKIRGDEK